VLHIKQSQPIKAQIIKHKITRITLATEKKADIYCKGNDL